MLCGILYLNRRVDMLIRATRVESKMPSLILPCSEFVEKFLIGSHLRLELFPHTKCQKKLSEMLVNIINESENYFGHFLSDDAVPNWTSSLFHKILLHVNSQHFFLSLWNLAKITILYFIKWAKNTYLPKWTKIVSINSRFLTCPVYVKLPTLSSLL